MNTDKKISRREALKRMGFAVMSSAIASSGLLSLASCETKRSKRIIFYFTGTGNSLYIARQLAGENAELLSIPQMVKRGKYEFEADEIGIVYPIYGHMPPYMVRQFIRKAKQLRHERATQDRQAHPRELAEDNGRYQQSAALARTGDGGGTATAPRFYAAEWTRPRGGLPDEKREVLYRD